jgi:phage antirepressor YoqD-like protein
MDTPGGRQNLTVINESGLYSLILSSKLPAAKNFKRWVTAEILPLIRRTGGYVGDDELFTNTYLPFADESVKALFTTTLSTIRQQNKQIEDMKPKADFFDAVADSKDAIDIGSTAKVLNMGIGRNRLFEILRSEGVLMANNQPYQAYIDRGFFRTIEQKYTKPDGSTHIYIKTLVYQKGLDYIRQIVANG